MPSTRPDGALAIELLTTGANAYGYGRLADTRDFAFRVRNRKARLEIYRAGADSVEPVRADVELVAERPTGSMNLDSQRSLTTLLRTLVAEAADVTSAQGADTANHAAQADAADVPADEDRTLRAYFVRMDAILDAWSVEAETDAAAEAEARSAPAPARRTLRDYLRRRAAA